MLGQACGSASGFRIRRYSERLPPPPPPPGCIQRFRQEVRGAVHLPGRLHLCLRERARDLLEDAEGRTIPEPRESDPITP